MWKEGTIKGYSWQAKVFEKASSYGIGSGTISKLAIWKNGKEIFNYDRSFDFATCSVKVLMMVLENIKESK